MKFRLVVEFDPEAKRWSAVIPELLVCATAGDTEAEAVTKAQEALARWFEPPPIKLPKGAKMIELAAVSQRSLSEEDVPSLSKTGRTE